MSSNGLKANDDAVLQPGFGWLLDVIFNEPTISLHAEIQQQAVASARLNMGRACADCLRSDRLPKVWQPSIMIGRSGRRFLLCWLCRAQHRTRMIGQRIFLHERAHVILCPGR